MERSEHEKENNKNDRLIRFLFGGIVLLFYIAACVIIAVSSWFAFVETLKFVAYQTKGRVNLATFIAFGVATLVLFSVRHLIGKIVSKPEFWNAIARGLQRIFGRQ